MSLVAEPGETVTLAGETGADESAVAKLLLRLYDVGESAPLSPANRNAPRSGDVSEGAVRVDGLDREIRLAEFRGAVGYVSQDVFLSDGTVRENVTYGSFDAANEAVVAAAKAAEAHEFVLGLPDGYDARVGERGVTLSAGQRQRLSIARALLQNPVILVLGEATSAVDTATELAIQRGLAHLTEGRTTLVVAHRLSTIRDADTASIIAEGRVAERGTRDELLALGGRYAALWGVQTGEPTVLDVPTEGPSPDHRLGPTRSTRSELPSLSCRVS